MTTHTKITMSSILFAASLLALPASAVDQAAAAADLAGIAAISVQSKANLSEAALGGDVDAIAEAGKRSDAVDASMAQAQEAYSEVERFSASGDEDAAQSAMDDLAAALEKAKDALEGVIPEEVVDAVKEWKNSKKNTGGGPGRPFDPPNMYDIPWHSQTMRDHMTEHWNNFWSSGCNPHDKDATPE